MSNNTMVFLMGCILVVWLVWLYFDAWLIDMQYQPEQTESDLAMLKTRYDLTLPTHLQEEFLLLTREPFVNTSTIGVSVTSN